MTSVATKHLRVAEGAARPVDVAVNNYRVTLTLDRMTGMEIKLEAAAQGADLEAGFHLSVKTGSRYRVIEDEEVIEVRNGQEFLAIAPDDNS
jgi:hypothetical protein